MDELGRHSTKWTEKQAIQMRDMECMSVKYPMPPLSPIPRKDLINEGVDDGDGSHTIVPGSDRYGFLDHVMPPPMKMSGGGGLQQSTHGVKGSIANIPTNDYEVSVGQVRERTPLFLSWTLMTRSVISSSDPPL